MSSSANAGCAAKWRHAAAIFVYPAQRINPMTVLRSAAMTCGIAPQQWTVRLEILTRSGYHCTSCLKPTMISNPMCEPAPGNTYMAETIDHDRLFKELLATFFVEFIDLFCPDLSAVQARLREQAS